LEEIASLLDEPGTDPVTHLRRQHELLTQRVDRLSTMVLAVEKELEARQMGIESCEGDPTGPAPRLERDQAVGGAVVGSVFQKRRSPPAWPACAPR
jgi:hypothetical protein